MGGIHLGRRHTNGGGTSHHRCRFYYFGWCSTNCVPCCRHGCCHHGCLCRCCALKMCNILPRMNLHYSERSIESSKKKYLDHHGHTRYFSKYMCGMLLSNVYVNN